MDLTFQNPGFSYSIDGILNFQRMGLGPWWTESLFYFYPQVDRAHFASLRPADQAAYLSQTLRPVYLENLPVIEEKLQAYARHWRLHRPQVEAAFSEAFGQDIHNQFNDITVRVTLNPICPRFLREHSFDLFYLNSEQGALGMSLHELVHFVWFHIWHEIFQDSYESYETPSLKWVLSEMVVEPILRDERLRTINPYFEGCVYEYFYSMQVQGQPVLETLYGLYRSVPLEVFMKRSYEFCQTHEAEIRAQMK